MTSALVPATGPSRLSRRALFGLGGSALALATAAAVLQRRLSRAEAATPAAADRPITYADHDGWMLSVGEKRALRAQAPPDGGR